jgi:hypothetical protein
MAVDQAPTRLFVAEVTHVDGTSWGARVNTNSEVGNLLRYVKDKGNVHSPVKVIQLTSTQEYLHYLQGPMSKSLGR